MAAEDQWRTADGVREPSPELLPERRRPSAEGGPRRSACTQERLSPRPRGAFLTARLAQPLTRLNCTCGDSVGGAHARGRGLPSEGTWLWLAAAPEMRAPEMRAPAASAAAPESR